MPNESIQQLEARLRAEFLRLNAERFGGELQEYRLVFSRNQVRTHGCINFRLRKITISAQMYEQHGWDAVVDTLLHEMTHGLLHQRGHHDRHTKLFYRELLARGGTRQKKLVKPKAAYIYACPTCGREFERMRKLKRPWARSCARCDKRYNPRHRLYLKKDKETQ
jgi:predicted SprT family Zn-dependent metalloprotease